MSHPIIDEDLELEALQAKEDALAMARDVSATIITRAMTEGNRKGRTLNKKDIREAVKKLQQNELLLLQDQLKEKMGGLASDSIDILNAPVEMMIESEIESLRNGSITNAMTENLIGKLTPEDIRMCHKIALNNKTSLKTIAKEEGITIDTLKFKMMSNPAITEYIQNITNINNDFLNFSRARNNGSIEEDTIIINEAISKVSKTIMNNLSYDNPEQDLKTLTKIRKIFSTMRKESVPMEKTENPNIMINNSISTAPASSLEESIKAEVETEEEKEKRIEIERNEQINSILKKNPINI